MVRQSENCGTGARQGDNRYCLALPRAKEYSTEAARLLPHTSRTRMWRRPLCAVRSGQHLEGGVGRNGPSTVWHRGPRGTRRRAGPWWSPRPLTVCRRQMFSRRDPIQPQKVRRNMRTPTTISRMAGSTARQARAASGREADPQLEPSALRGGSQGWMGVSQTVLPVQGNLLVW